MRTRKPSQRIAAIFRTFYRPERINRLVRNLLVTMPKGLSKVQKMTIIHLSRAKHLLHNLIHKSDVPRRNITINDLELLKKTLALKLPRSYRYKLPAGNKNEFKQFHPGTMLQEQAQLLRSLLTQQQQELKRQSAQILEEERNRIRKNADRPNHQ